MPDSASRLRCGVRHSERPAIVAHCCWSDMMCRMFGRLTSAGGFCAAAAAVPSDCVKNCRRSIVILSEQNTHTGFNLPGRPRRADHTECRGAEHRSGVTEIGMVEGVEELAAKFGAQPFADTESAQHRKIQVDQARTAHDACSRV